MKTAKALFLFCLLVTSQTFSQVYSNKVVGKKNQSEIDSLKTQEYPYVLPIWGDKATKKGFKLPLSAGISVNYLTQKSDLVIDNLNIGFNNGPMYNVDEIIRFNNSVAEADVLTIRPDIWLFPFLNVYAILGKAKTSTAISAGIWLPDSENNWTELTSFSSKANFDATSFGLGVTPTIGIGGGWLALDMNVAWSDVDALDKPVTTFVFGPRLGKTFKFKKPDSNIALWVGGFRVHLSSETNGSLALSEVIPENDLQQKVDDGIIKVEERKVAVDDWWNNLSNLEQNSPVNIAKYETANRVLDKTGNLLNSIDGALSNAGTATVQYSLDKKLKDMWNFIIGSQYQLNRSWMLRAEYGFLGSRTQFMASLQYRFGL